MRCLLCVIELFKVSLTRPQNGKSPSPNSKNVFGCMKGTVVIKGDIISPIGEDDWEALRFDDFS